MKIVDLTNVVVDCMNLPCFKVQFHSGMLWSFNLPHYANIKTILEVKSMFFKSKNL